jgi:hypothetical protein
MRLFGEWDLENLLRAVGPQVTAVPGPELDRGHPRGELLDRKEWGIGVGPPVPPDHVGPHVLRLVDLLNR